MGTARCKRCSDILGREHAGQHGIVASLDARHVHETGSTADKRTAWKHELRHRLPAAFGERTGAIANALAAGEGAADERMGLETLKFFERRQIRIGVVEMDDKAD